MSDTEESLNSLLNVAQVSRLRRRGAMRMDSGVDVTALFNTLSGPQPSEDDGATPWERLMGRAMNREFPTRGTQSPSVPRTQSHELRSIASKYKLLCGAPLPPPLPWEKVYEPPSERPVLFPFYNPSPSASPSIPPPPQSNGCGSLIHTEAVPSTKSSSWIAKGDATDIVVPLEDCYFDEGRGRRKQERRSCGCVWEGVGCSVCGLPLGTVHLPCTRHSPTLTLKALYTFITANTTSIPELDMEDELPEVTIPLALTAQSSSALHTDDIQELDRRRRPKSDFDEDFDPDGLFDDESVTTFENGGWVIPRTRRFNMLPER